jgi:N-hydroxyarylamine O-acetyltransferase
MSFKTEALSTGLLERVLTKLGLSNSPAPTLDGLRTLYAAWCRKVPFDNVRKLIHVQNHDPGPLPGDDATDFFEAWLTYGTGGTCWSGNGALHALLVSLGFEASRGMATMLSAPHVPPNHGTVLVTCDETRVVVDASILHSEPLRLDVSMPTGVAHPAWGVRCSRRDSSWYIRWRPMHKPEGLDCRIDHLHVTRQTFRERHELTRAWSPFNYELHARLIRGDAVVGTALGQRVEFNNTGGVAHKCLEGDDRIRLLVDELGMQEDIVCRLPCDTPTPPPPWSQTARNADRDHGA